MTDPDLITSAANPVVKLVRKLSDRRARRAERAGLVWGIQPVMQAAEAGHPIRRLLVAPDLLRPDAARAFVARAETDGTAVSRLSGELFTRIADRDHPTGLAAIVETVDVDLATVDLDDAPGTLLALDRVANPGNLGSILRSAEATGCRLVVLVGPGADVWDPATIKASMGAVFTTPVARIDDLGGLLDWAERHDWTVVTTAARADHPLWGTPFPDRTLVLLGSEQQGLDDDTLAAGALRVSIPMTGTAESLNLASAATVLLYEIWRRRVAH